MHLHIYLDLDLTLVDVFPLWRALWIDELAARLHMDAEDVYERGESIWTHGDRYTLRKHLRLLGVDPAQNPWAVNLERRFQRRIESGSANYSDTGSFLDELARDGLTCSILSFGDPGYQGMKVRGLQRPEAFFQHKVYTRAFGEKARVLALAADVSEREQVVFVDDSAREHKSVAEFAPRVRRIQIRRNDDIALSSDVHHVVTNLTGALEKIQHMAEEG